MRWSAASPGTTGISRHVRNTGAGPGKNSSEIPAPAEFLAANPFCSVYVGQRRYCPELPPTLWRRNGYKRTVAPRWKVASSAFRQKRKTHVTRSPHGTVFGSSVSRPTVRLGRHDDGMGDN